MNFGQMLLWHVVLLPIVLGAIVGAHVLLVRIHGVSRPLPAKPVRWRDRAARKAAATADAAPWRGPTRRYDILKEGTIATLIALVLVMVCAGVLSSPDVPPVTVQSWGEDRPRRLPRHRGQRTQRHQQDRRLRSAVQQRYRQRSAAGVLLPPDVGRGDPACQRGAGLRDLPAVEGRPRHPAPR